VKALRYWWCLPLAGILFLILKEAVSLVPESWPSFQDALHPQKAVQVDSGLFEGDSTLEEVSIDTSVDAVCKRVGAFLQSAQSDVRSVKNNGEKIGLCSFEFRTGRPLVEQVWELKTAMEQEGYALSESSEKPGTKYAWLGRISKGGSVRAVVRARIGDKPLPGANALRVVLWADSLTAPVLGRLEKLPANVILALPPEAMAEERLHAIVKAAGLHLAVLTRLETERRPLVLQQKTRILLHHTAKDVEKRLGVRVEDRPFVEGLVVLDGERGAQDPLLASRVVAQGKSNGWWFLDASMTSNSRLDSTARAIGVSVLPHPVTRAATAKATLEDAIQAALRSGSALCSLPLDTNTLELVRRRVPLLEPEGITLRPPVQPDSSRKEN